MRRSILLRWGGPIALAGIVLVGAGTMANAATAYSYSFYVPGGGTWEGSAQTRQPQQAPDVQVELATTTPYSESANFNVSVGSSGCNPNSLYWNALQSGMTSLSAPWYVNDAPGDTVKLVAGTGNYQGSVTVNGTWAP